MNASGTWYSFPEMGQCTGNQKIGDNGCTWKVQGVKRTIMARCMYEHLDNNVEQFDPTCFSACPQPRWFTPAMYACMTLFVFHSRHINMITFHVPSNGKHTLARIQARAHATSSLTHSIPHPHFYHTNVDLHTHQNVTSDCYLQCYDTATNQMTHEQLMAPWIKSFSSTDPTQGGCPDAPKYLL